MKRVPVLLSKEELDMLQDALHNNEPSIYMQHYDDVELGKALEFAAKLEQKLKDVLATFNEEN